MTGSFTGRAVAEMVQKYAGSHPVGSGGYE